MARTNWLKYLEDLLAGFVPSKSFDFSIPKIGTEGGRAQRANSRSIPKPKSFTNLTEAEARDALKNSGIMNIVDRAKGNIDPYMADNIGSWGKKDSLQMNRFEDNSWLNPHAYVTEATRFIKEPQNALARVNEKANQLINRGAFGVINALESKIPFGLGRKPAEAARRAVRNTARGDRQMLRGKKGKSILNTWNPYAENMARAEEARGVADTLAYDQIHKPYVSNNGAVLEALTGTQNAKTVNRILETALKTVREGKVPTGELQYRTAMADYYKPSRAYRAIRTGIKAAPGVALANALFNQTEKRASKSGVKKSISSMSQHGTRHVVGGYRGGKMSKSMDMKTKSPSMPSTKRDVRHTDKYFR